MKSGDAGPLGNHKHWYPEVMYVLKGKCHYWLKNKEGEEMECDMEESDVPTILVEIPDLYNKNLIHDIERSKDQ